MGFLELIKQINKATRNINQGEMCVYNDNKKLLYEIEKERCKESECTQEAGATVTEIK